MINHPLGNDLYQLCMVIWGMDYYCHTNITILQLIPHHLLKVNTRLPPVGSALLHSGRTCQAPVREIHGEKAMFWVGPPCKP